MSSAVETTAVTIQQRSAQATRELCSALGIGAVSPNNLKYLSLALIEAAREEIVGNASFAEQVRTRYEASLPAKPTRIESSSGSSTRSRGEKAWRVQLTPVGTVDEALLDPYAPPNAFALRQLYGDEQLPLALGRYSPAQLKAAVPVVQERYPGTKPKKMTKAGIIEYILQTLIGTSAAVMQ